MAARRMLVLRNAMCRMAESRVRLGGSPDREVVIPIPIYAIETDDGWVLFDTGCDPAIIEDLSGTWGRLAKAFNAVMTPEDHPHLRLAEHGISPDDVTHVIVSHLHMDHAGGIKLFPKAEVHVQRAEMRWAAHPDSFGATGFLPGDFDHPARYVFHEGDAQVVPGVHVVLAEGHTPGHQIGVVDLPSGRFVITGDAAYLEEQVEKIVPPPVTTDAYAAVRSLRRIRAFAERDEARILVNHDLEQWESMEKELR